MVFISACGASFGDYVVVIPQETSISEVVKLVETFGGRKTSLQNPKL